MANINICFNRGDLRVALDLYRKAETYVPDNIKLKERWILFVIDVFLLKLSSAHEPLWRSSSFLASVSPMVVIHGNRIIEIEWAFKNNKDYVPSPKPRNRKSKNKRKGKSHLGRENTAKDEGGMQAVVEFGMEITNTESPVGSKRSFVDTGSTQTPLKRRKRMEIATPVVQVSSEDEHGPPVVA